MEQSSTPLTPIEVKITIFGDKEVGKSSLITRFCDDLLPQPGSYIDDIRTVLKVVDGMKMKLQIWDLPGQVSPMTIPPAHCKKSLGAIYVFDVTDDSTFHSIEQWIEYTSHHFSKEPKRLLLGNKADMRNERQVHDDEIEEICTKYNLKYGDVSAWTGQGVNDCFMELARDIKTMTSKIPRGDMTISLLDNKQKKKKKRLEEGEDVSGPGCCI